jgi:hypothetical protein
LEELPCCTTGPDGRKSGDPLNLVMVGGFKTVLQALVRAGWHLTEPEDTAAYWRTFKSFLFGKQYQSAPVSHLYAFGRSQDMALQKPRHTIKQRNHMRLWVSPYRLRGVPVWVGQISRLLSQVLDTVGWVKGVEVAEPENARKNLTGDHYYTDGLRVVLVLSEELVDVQNIQRLDWELPPEPPLDVDALETRHKR